MKRNNIFLVALLICFAACKTAKYSDLDEGIYADIQTNKGDILIQLTYDKTPVTVANFVSLAEGTNTFVTDSLKGKPYYDGIKFHRVIKDFMIQGGDPLGTGAGDPGYKFGDEFTNLKHDKPGILSMANSGKNTNGSQFFITHKPTPWLDNKHSVFGEVVANPNLVKSIKAKITDSTKLGKSIDSLRMSVVNAIVRGDTIHKIDIIRNGASAKAFDANKIFSEGYEKDKAKAEEEIKKAKELLAKTVEKFEAQKAKAVTLPSGLQYYITEKGTGPKLKKTSKVMTHYAVYFADGKLLETSKLETAEALGKVNQQKKAAGAYRPIPADVSPEAKMIAGFKEGLQQLSIGDKATIFIPYHLAYGEGGTRGIPPKSDLIFELEPIEFVKE